MPKYEMVDVDKIKYPEGLGELEIAFMKLLKEGRDRFKWKRSIIGIISESLWDDMEAISRSGEFE